MSITYEADLVDQHIDDQTIYFTLTDSTPTSYDWCCDADKGINIQNYLDSKEEEFLLLIRKYEYEGGIAGRDYEPDPLKTDLENYEDWISAGAPIKDDEGTILYYATYVPWTYEVPAIVTTKANKGQGTLMERIANLEDAVFGVD